MLSEKPAIRNDLRARTLTWDWLPDFLLRRLNRMCWGGVVGFGIAVAFNRLYHWGPNSAAQIKGALDSVHRFWPSNKTEWALVCSVVAVMLFPLSRWVRRFLRSWWTGILSFSFGMAAIVAIAIASFGITALGIGISITLLVGLIGLEGWRQFAAERRKANAPQIILNLPREVEPGMRGEWSPSAGDEAIQSWDQDLLGRKPTVQQIAEFAFRLHAPVVALHGAYGDGKTSVLRLLRASIPNGSAVVISFNASLPDAQSLPLQLFRDIANECRKHVFAPNLQKVALSFARTASGSFTYLGGLKEVLPVHSQQDDIAALRELLRLLPYPVLVLVDEVDRMHVDEILMLLKLVRGADSIPNVTFVCAFDEQRIRAELGDVVAGTPNYLEKHFPVSVSLSPPDSDTVGRLVLRHLLATLASQGWLGHDDTTSAFTTGFDLIWRVSLSHLCSNLRQAGLLANDIALCAGLIAGEISCMDFVLIEVLRLFAPDVHAAIRNARASLVEGGGRFMLDVEETDKSAFDHLNKAIGAAKSPEAVRQAVFWLFPRFEANASSASWPRPNEATGEEEKRICRDDYFYIAFSGGVPGTRYSNREMKEFLKSVVAGRPAEIKWAFSNTWMSLTGDRREDFLRKLSREAAVLAAPASERLAYAAIENAAGYSYADRGRLGEATPVRNLVLNVIQSLTAERRQDFLDTVLSSATDDRLAQDILFFTDPVNASRNDMLHDYTGLDFAHSLSIFAKRMRTLYEGQGSKIALERLDWQSLRRWAEHSEEDRTLEQQFWRDFIGSRRKRLAQAVGFIYPGDVIWRGDPSDLINKLFPLDEIRQLLSSTAPEGLTDSESRSIERITRLLSGQLEDLPGQ